MKSFKSHYNQLNKLLCILLTISISYYPCLKTSSLSAKTKDTLAASSRINKYEETNKLGIDTVKFTMAVSSLRETILGKEKTTKKQVLAAIKALNKNLEEINIKFAERIYEVRLQKRKSEAICIKVIFPDDEVRWIYFIKEHGEVPPDILEKIGIKTQEDKDYFNQSPLAGVWISKNGPESRYETGNRITASVLLIPLLAFLLPSCLEPPSLKDFEGFCFKGEDCVVTDSFPSPDVPEDSPGDTVSGDAIIYPLETSPDMVEPEKDVAEPSPEVVEPEKEVVETVEPTQDTVEPPSDAVEFLPEVPPDIQVQEVVEPEEVEPDTPVTKETVDTQDTQEDIVQQGIIVPVESIPTNCNIDQPPITILSSPIDGTSYLSTNPDFVCENNAAFRYQQGSKSQINLSTDDIQNILLFKGLNYVHNEMNHSIKIIGIDSDDLQKTITFTSDEILVPGIYKVGISPLTLIQYITQSGIDISKPMLLVLENQGSEELIINGFQKQYTVLATSGEVTPDKISPEWGIFSFGGAGINVTPTPQGVSIGFSMTAGDNGQSGGINISTKSGGINLAKPNLKGAWKMDEADIGIDSGPNGNLLTNVNGVVSVPGKYGNAAGFNNSYLEILDGVQNGLDPTGNMTVACWVKLNSLTGHTPIISKYDLNSPPPSGTGRSYELGINVDGTVNWLVSNNGHDVHGGAVQSTNILPGQWYHIAAVRDNNQLRVYVNGVEIIAPGWPNPYPWGVIHNSSTPFRIGNEYNSLFYLDGLIDEVAVFDKALTPEEIQGIYNQVDSSNFLKPALSTIDLKARGDSPFILRLIDNAGWLLDVFILDLDPVKWRSITVDILQAQGVMNPFFNLGNVKSAQILFKDTLLPVPEGEELDVKGTIEIEGLIGIPPTTRHRYATDDHDIDMTREDYTYLTNNLDRAQMELLETKEGVPVIGIKGWQDESGRNILLQNGLGFTVNGRIYSAFTVTDGKRPIIYIPHPEVVKNSLRIEDIYIRAKILNSTEIRNSIILGHEMDEVNTHDHGEAVFNEFSRNSINGLNYADVVTVLLETLSSGNITAIDEDFHRQFIANLLIQGMSLDKEGNTYLRIIREIVDDRINEASLRETYRNILSRITDTVSSYRFTHRHLSKDETTIPDSELVNEPGFKELFNSIKEPTQGGTINIDLAKFLVRNNSLATDDEVVTINMEYLKRFANFVHRLQGRNIKVIGIYSERRQGTAIIEQLMSIIREDLGLQFPIQAVDFSRYLEFIGGPENARNTVSILTEDSWQNIPDRSILKIVDSFMDRYNRVNSSGWEFYTALKGLEFDTPQTFLQFIIDALLQQLVTQKVITEDEALVLRKEIIEKGIAFIPTYYDPIQYYKTIESQKELIIAA